MTDSGASDVPPQRNVYPGRQSPTHAGDGNQFNLFKDSSWVQACSLIVVGLGTVVEIVMAPEGSGTQHFVYGVMVILCGITAALCLWFAYERARKKLAASLALVMGAVLSAGIAAGCYKVLADHGDLTVPVTVRKPKPLADKGRSTADIDAGAARSYVRVRVTLPDHYSDDTCVASAKAEVMPSVDGVAREADAVTLMSGHSGDIDLNGARRHVELDAVVRAGKGCLVDLSFESAVLHDDEWWLP
ncbi:hypothetical protein ACFYXJ_35825 [Streptomyces sp. NPDC002667]|uniref:hypothetical protein n=1 Tax=Streptomyces sp. NPDC002667 TaxID=3364657 RepID=UPI0036ACE2B0